MSNYIEYKDKIIYHPGYYIKEIVDDSGLTQEAFARRLNTTPKNLSVLIKGNQSLSIDMAVKLSRMLKTNVETWLNIQKTYDIAVAQIQSEEELIQERKTFKYIDYNYFVKNYDLPKSANIDEQIKNVREFLNLASINVLKNVDDSINYKDYNNTNISEIINSNIMIQIGINEVINTKAPGFDRNKLQKTIKQIQNIKEADKNNQIKKKLSTIGIVLITIPSIKNTKISGATKKIKNKIMILINEDCTKDDSIFSHILFHEIGHIVNGDYGNKSHTKVSEEKAEEYAKNNT